MSGTYTGVIEMEPIPNDGDPIYLDEKQLTDAYATTIESGKDKGAWIFTSRERAEEFCWKRGMSPKFLRADE